LSRYTFDPATNEATFVGFRDPSFAALPSLTGGGAGYYQRPVRITAMTAGDYDNDGVMDIAVNTIQRAIQGNEGNVLMVLRGDADPSQISDLNPAGATGRFFADSVNGGPDGFYAGLGGGEDSVILRSSAVV